MKRKLIVMAVCASFVLGVTAAKPMKAPSGDKKISNELIGIFFEDISMSADGGLCAELIQNGSFEFSPSERDGWGPGTAWRSIRPGHSLGYIEPKQQDPIHPNNPNYMRLNIERVGMYYDYNGWTGVGIQNDGYDGILLKGGDKYDFSVFLRNPDGKDKEVRAVLLVQGRGFRAQPTVIADTTFTVSGRNWKKYEYTLTAAQDCPNASLQLLSLTTGVMDIDMVSLYPQDTYMGHGMRKDLAQALVDLNPKFMRFPGGCVVHGGGDGFWDTYRWKTTVGPKETRKGTKNTWGYHQSMEMGFFEYFQFCEDAGMEPLPILPCGVSCQGTNGGWNMRTQAQDAVPMSEMQEWADEALDLIEWANGPVTSKWGKIRADAGHPEPFNLKYLGLGNEEKITPEFEERFKFIYDQVRAKYPDIVIVGTAGPGSHPGNGDYEEGWNFATQLDVPILDEHYYEQRNFFLTSRQYDSYPRDRKTKVYLGEYASKDKKLIDALAEGLYLFHVERNADIVVMTSYAPLFARKNTNNWNPDLIYFDNERPYLTCSYYVQQMFGQSSGDWFYGDCVKFDREDDNLLGQSVVLDTQARKLYLKVCNAGENAAKADINLSRFGGFKSVTKTTISGQPNDENGFDAQPIAPVTETVKIKSKTTLDIEPYSITLYSISL
ncbi:MAG: alpha-N-arabinofuranosidase [Bacteroidaceae bacterium]|nr:alpha-N-arabinofuranosidase [Bacteroidaceae bacterium]